MLKINKIPVKIDLRGYSDTLNPETILEIIASINGAKDLIDAINFSGDSMGSIIEVVAKSDINNMKKSKLFLRIRDRLFKELSRNKYYVYYYNYDNGRYIVRRRT